MIPGLKKKNVWKIYRSDLREPDGSLYMTRWIFQTPWFGIRLHKIAKSDAGRDWHDHPFAFVSFILWGGYLEARPLLALGGKHHCEHSVFYGPGSVVRRKATDLHRLTLTRPAWTLVFAGPYKRNWGFETEEGWVDFESYHRSLYRPERVEK